MSSIRECLEADPGYAAWKAAILEQLDSLDTGDVVVGHSIGGIILLQVIAEQPPIARPGEIFLARNIRDT